jgi:hypothetical protein
VLKQEEIREVLSRAEEIQRGGARLTREDEEMLVQAAEEAGLSRSAVLQALRERLGAGVEPPAPGTKVFARSGDGHMYVAEVLDIKERGVQVRFVSGGEHTVAFDEVKPLTLLPGQKIMCDWPRWGWNSCRVTKFDAETATIRASDGWKQRDFSLTEIRIRTEPKPRTPRTDWFWVWITTSAAGGTLLGAILALSTR